MAIRRKCRLSLAAPISPYGWSKLMTEITLRDAATAHDLRYCILRYFNVAAPIPSAAPGSRQEAALGLRPKLDIYGTDYSTPDGTCIRDYIHVSDLVPVRIRTRCAICVPAAPQ